MTKESSMIQEKTFAEQIADKKRFQRKLYSSIAFGFVFAVVLIIVVLACVPVNLAPVSIERPSDIYFNGNSNASYAQDTTVYKDVMERYEDAFNTNYLTAIFSGRLGGYTVQQNDENDKWFTALPSIITSGNYITFSYWKNEEPVLKDANGNDVIPEWDSSSSILVKEVIFPLSSQNKTDVMDVYFKYEKKKNSSATTMSTYYVKISIKANTFALNEYYEENIK